METLDVNGAIPLSKRRHCLETYGRVDSHVRLSPTAPMRSGFMHSGEVSCGAPVDTATTTHVTSVACGTAYTISDGRSSKECGRGVVDCAVSVPAKRDFVASMGTSMGSHALDGQAPLGWLGGCHTAKWSTQCPHSSVGASSCSWDSSREPSPTGSWQNDPPPVEPQLLLRSILHDEESGTPPQRCRSASRSQRPRRTLWSGEFAPCSSMTGNSLEHCELLPSPPELLIRLMDDEVRVRQALEKEESLQRESLVEVVQRMLDVAVFGDSSAESEERTLVERPMPVGASRVSTAEEASAAESGERFYNAKLNDFDQRNSSQLVSESSARSLSGSPEQESPSFLLSNTTDYSICPSIVSAEQGCFLDGATRVGDDRSRPSFWALSQAPCVVVNVSHHFTDSLPGECRHLPATESAVKGVFLRDSTGKELKESPPTPNKKSSHDTQFQKGHCVSGPTVCYSTGERGYELVPTEDHAATVGSPDSLLHPHLRESAGHSFCKEILEHHSHVSKGEGECQEVRKKSEILGEFFCNKFALSAERTNDLHAVVDTEAPARCCSLDEGPARLRKVAHNVPAELISPLPSRPLLGEAPPHGRVQRALDGQIQSGVGVAHAPEFTATSLFPVRWDARRSGNVIVSRRGNICLGDASRARKVNFTRPQRPCGNTPRLSFPMYALGNVGALAGELVFEVRFDASPSLSHTSCLFSIGVATKHYQGTHNSTPFFLYRSDGSIISNANDKQGVRYGPPFHSGSCVTVYLNLFQLELSFFLNGQPLGAAFKFRETRDPEPLVPLVVLGAERDTATLVAPSVLATVAI